MKEVKLFVSKMVKFDIIELHWILLLLVVCFVGLLRSLLCTDLCTSTSLKRFGMWCLVGWGGIYHFHLIYSACFRCFAPFAGGEGETLFDPDLAFC